MAWPSPRALMARMGRSGADRASCPIRARALAWSESSEMTTTSGLDWRMTSKKNS
jgi:hypothetical protein